MEYRWLGSTGVRVSPLCMGVMTFGDAADERESARMFERCLAVGINFFDCANVYGGGESERVLGRLMAGKRDELVITSKVGMGGGLNGSGGSRRHIMQEVEASLRRLGTDRLDIYFLHSYDDDTPLEETLRAFDDLVRQGENPVSRGEQLGSLAGLRGRRGFARCRVGRPSLACSRCIRSSSDKRR